MACSQKEPKKRGQEPVINLTTLTGTAWKQVEPSAESPQNKDSCAKRI